MIKYVRIQSHSILYMGANSQKECENPRMKKILFESYGWHGERDPEADETRTSAGSRNNFGTHLAAQIRACQQCSDSSIRIVYSIGNMCRDIKFASYLSSVPDGALVHYQKHDSNYGAKLRQTINDDGDPYLIEMASNLTDQQLNRLAKLVI